MILDCMCEWWQFKCWKHPQQSPWTFYPQECFFFGLFFFFGGGGVVYKNRADLIYSKALQRSCAGFNIIILHQYTVYNLHITIKQWQEMRTTLTQTWELKSWQKSHKSELCFSNRWLQQQSPCIFQVIHPEGLITLISHCLPAQDKRKGLLTASANRDCRKIIESKKALCLKFKPKMSRVLQSLVQFCKWAAKGPSSVNSYSMNCSFNWQLFPLPFGRIARTSCKEHHHAILKLINNLSNKNKENHSHEGDFDTRS